MAGREKSDGGNQSVARALTILNLLASRSEPLGVREIARQLRLAPSIAQRLLKTLAKAGFLEQTGTTLRYMIGYKAFQVGNAFTAQTNLHSAVMPELYALAEQQINGFLGVLRDRSVVYLATVQSNGPVALNHRPGAQAHLHSTAMGKALLAEMPEDEAQALLTQRALPRLTPHSRTNPTQLMAELRSARARGYTTSEEENRAGFFSAGAVVRDATGRGIAVISGAVPITGLKEQDRARIGRLVVEAAHNASRKLGAPNTAQVYDLSAERPTTRLPRVKRKSSRRQASSAARRWHERR
ncbi:MAG TPA: IclR family transcriptional regulator [Pseudolabrys sp.]|nr:IclR family transcriptional regulator [Pseudolabrys sp.]